MSESLFEIEDPTSSAQSLGWLDRKFRAAVWDRLAAVEHGGIRLVDGDRVRSFGTPGSTPSATIRVLDPRLYASIALGGAIGAAEAYMDGLFEADDLTQAIRVIAVNRKALDHLDGRVARLLKPILRAGHRMRDNNLDGSRRNIAAHYDLGNDFFELLLDKTMTYSSGLFADDTTTMAEASHAKYTRLGEKLALGPNDHLLEIGCGWGGMAIHAASHFGCQVTATTISEQQYRMAKERVEAAGLTDRITLLFEDYRELRGRYDKLVSIEMIEAVGAAHWEEYFRVCSERLSEQGVMAIQAISVRDQDLSSSLKSVDFIKKYIFPGGQLVSLSSVVDAMATATDLRPTHYEDITPHYAETLRRWRAQMNTNLDPIRELGLDDRFLAMWEFYLCYCEASFMERSTHAFQMVFEKSMVRRVTPLGPIAEARTPRL